MKPLLVSSAVLCAVALGCGGSDSSSSPSTPSGPAPTSVTYTVALFPANEVPPVANAEGGVTGTATVTVHATRNAAGNVASATLDLVVNATGFPANAALNMAHVHPGNSGVNGGVLFDTGMTPGTVPIVNGSVSFTRSGLTLPADQAQAILSNPAGHYFNIHSSLNPGGVARGQLSGGSGSGGDGAPPAAPY